MKQPPLRGVAAAGGADPFAFSQQPLSVQHPAPPPAAVA
eukprot:gene8462-11191_t